MNYNEIVESVTEAWKISNQLVFEIEGPPGAGKSMCARGIVRSLGGTPENTVEFNPSLRQPVDVLGTPRNIGLPYTEWVPPSEFYKLRDGVGECFLIIEERGDADMDMQNVLCRIVYDRYAGDFKLSDKLHIITTTNRTQDKSGAYRTSTKLAGRMVTLKFDVNLDQWATWYLGTGRRLDVLQYIRFKPDALLDFDPNRQQNATPRTWEYVSLLPATIGKGQFQEMVFGSVGEGRGVEYMTFRDVWQSLPTREEILMAPDKVKIPERKDIVFAMCGIVVSVLDEGNVDRMYGLIERMPQEYTTMIFADAVRRNTKLLNTKSYIKWATANAKYMV